MDSLTHRVGIELKKVRKEKGYTTEELSKILSISMGKLNNIEHGKSDCFQFELVHDINKALGIDIYEMCGSAFYSKNISYPEYDIFIEELVAFLRNNSEDVNNILIKKIGNEIKFIADIKKTISES